MGEPAEVWEERIKELSPYQVNKKLMDNAGEKAVFMQDLQTFKEELNMYIADKFVNNSGKYKAELLNADRTQITYGGKNQVGTVVDIISIGGTKYEEMLFVQEGKLMIYEKKATQKEIEWAREANVVTELIGITETVPHINGVEVTVEPRYPEKVESYTYVIYEVDEAGNKTEVAKKENETTSKTSFDSLEPGTKYEIVTTVKYNDGTTEELVKEVTTQEVIGTVEIIQIPAKGWVKDKVEIELLYKNDIPSGYELQYQIGTEEWKEYTEKFEVTENILVKARLYNETTEDEISVNSKSVFNIDKDAPDISLMQVEITVDGNSVTAVASGATDSLSGNVSYKYSIDNSTWYTSGTFGGYKSGTEVTVYVKAVDKVGNESESISDKGIITGFGLVEITQIPDATTSTGNINWTNDNVKVTLSHSVIEGYTLQYKLSGGMTKNWTTYTGEIEITTNETTVTARIYNEDLDDEGNSTNSKIISNIDNKCPTIPSTLTLTASETTITAIASGSTDEGVGNITYWYSKDNKTWQESTEFSGLIAGKSYTIYAKAIDELGNESEIKQNTIKCVSSDIYISASRGNDETADGSQQYPFATVKAGLEAAVDGSKVFIEAGEYNLTPILDTSVGGNGLTDKTEVDDKSKALEIYGENEKTILIYKASQTSRRDASAFAIYNENSIVRNLTYVFYPKSGSNYSRAVFRWCKGTIQNVFIRVSGSYKASHAYYNDQTVPTKVTNCTIYHDKGSVDSSYSGTITWTKTAVNYSSNANTGDATFGDANTSISDLIKLSKQSEIYNSNQAGVFYGDYAWK